MSIIARRLTKLTEDQLREYDFCGVGSKAEIFTVRCVNLRQNVRFGKGAIVGIQDLNPERQRLAKSTPKSLQP